MTFAEYRMLFAGQTFMYSNGCSAIKDFLQYLDARTDRADPNVLLPSYICANVYSAVLALGIEVKFYEVDDRCVPNLDHIRSLINDGTLSFLWVHYFGHANEAQAARRLADEHGTTMLEDCAHTIDAHINGQQVGTFGHAAFFCPWKTLRCAEGGMLVLNDKSYRDFRPHYTSKFSDLKAMSGFTLGKIRQMYEMVTGLPAPRRALKRHPNAIDVPDAIQSGVAAASPVSLGWIERQDVDAITRQRRENYGRWKATVAELDTLRPVFTDCGEGMTPYSFPMFVVKGNRDALRLQLLRSGIPTDAGFPEAPFHARFDGTTHLAQHLLELPVHQLFSSHHFNRAKDVLRAWEREHC